MRRMVDTLKRPCPTLQSEVIMTGERKMRKGKINMKTGLGDEGKEDIKQDKEMYSDKGKEHAR
jgi:hypothetical protein